MIININNKLNITLCGMMGSGKSLVGKILAKKTDYHFLDIDKLIEEETKKSINKIFEEDGEDVFRDLEEKITIQMLKNKKTVLSLGGGAMNNKNIRNYINKYSYNIYLSVNIDILKTRLTKSKNRPLLKKIDLDSKLNDLMKKRVKFYKTADLTINNESTIEKTINNILNILGNV